jgi:putative phosphoribosyl transferase
MIILALPRGGVPVALEIARALHAPLDLMLVRKLGTPGRPELAMGAIATNQARVLNAEVVRAYGIEESQIDEVENREREEIQRRNRVYRGDRPAPALEGLTVVLVDDGLATGATMRAAIRAARNARAHKVVVAVPVAPVETAHMLRREADELHCLATPQPFLAIGQWYQHFDQVSDDEVKAILERSWGEQEASHSTGSAAATER